MKATIASITVSTMAMRLGKSRGSRAYDASMHEAMMKSGSRTLYIQKPALRVTSKLITSREYTLPLDDWPGSVV